MSRKHFLTGNILTNAGWMRGRVSFGDHIESVQGRSAEPADNQAPYIVPGFIDLHVHGGAGVDVMSGGEALRELARHCARSGTTSFLATTLTATDTLLRRTLRELGAVCRETVADGAVPLGIHLEGPYISPHRLGAQPDAARPADLDEIDQYRGLAPIRVLTLAPEVAANRDAIGALVQRGIRVQVGHSVGTYDETVVALDCGAKSFTHLFNAMSGMSHRDNGVVGAALAHARYAEVIADLIHVEAGALRVALRAIPRLYVVTDATAAAGMPDGQYTLGGQRVCKADGAVRLEDGTLAGSALTMDQALRNLVGIGMDLADAARRLSTYPAEYVGLRDRGRIKKGAWADLVVLDRKLNVTAVIGQGVELWAH